MNFNSPLARTKQPIHAEGTILASNRDHRNNSLLWKKSSSNTQQDFRNGEALKKLQQDVAKIRRVKTGIPSTVSSLEFFPFRIYNVPVPVGAPAGTAPWQCWQVRTGIAAGRSQYFINTGNFGDYYVQGEERQQVITGSDNNTNYQSTNISTNPLYTNDLVLISDTAVATCAQNHTATWIINSTTLDAFHALNYAFWIELVDDVTLGLHFEIRAQRWTHDVATPIQHFPYPITTTVIPIGTLSAFGDNWNPAITEPVSPFNLQPFQVLFDHAVNRWNASAGGVYASHFRGDWDTVKGQLFWNGDEITWTNPGDGQFYLLGYIDPFPAVNNDTSPLSSGSFTIKAIS